MSEHWGVEETHEGVGVNFFSMVRERRQAWKA